MQNNIIDSIQLSGVTYTIQGSGGGGNPTVELTQAEYDALVTAGTVSANTYYIITDASAGDLTQYWTSAQTNSAINQAVSGKVDTTTYSTYTAATDTALSNKQTTLTAGTGIDITDNVISAIGGGGGGKAVTGGTNISVTTGTTADTINCTLPFEKINYYSIYCGNNTLLDGGYYNFAYGANNNLSYSSSFGKDNVSYNFMFGKYNTIESNSSSYKPSYNLAFGQSNKITNAFYSYVFGYANHIYSHRSFAVGEGNKTYNNLETAFGYYNNSVSASTTFGDSGNTLFSVGNGTADNARHNALEIRQNGDIYCSDGTNDVKLQDYLTVKLLPITQNDYDALVSGGTVDASTLYLIGDSNGYTMKLGTVNVN